MHTVCRSDFLSDQQKTKQTTIVVIGALRVNISMSVTSHLPQNFACWVKISADDILNFFLLFFLKNRVWHFMHIMFLGDNLHEVLGPIF